MQSQIKNLEIETPIYLIYQIYVPTKRKIDSSNFYCIIEKFLMDALVQSGKLPDDNDDYIRHRMYLPSIYEKGRDETIVRIFNKMPFEIK